MENWAFDDLIKFWNFNVILQLLVLQNFQLIFKIMLTKLFQIFADFSINSPKFLMKLDGFNYKLFWGFGLCLSDFRKIAENILNKMGN
jgi:hypothetical protein